MGHSLQAFVEHPSGARAEIPLMNFRSPTGRCEPQTVGPSVEWDRIARAYQDFCEAEIQRWHKASIQDAISARFAEGLEDDEPDEDGMTLTEHLGWIEEDSGARATEPGKTIETLRKFGELGFKLIWAWD